MTQVTPGILTISSRERSAPFADGLGDLKLVEGNCLPQDTQDLIARMLHWVLMMNENRNHIAVMDWRSIENQWKITERISWEEIAPNQQ